MFVLARAVTYAALTKEQYELRSKKAETGRRPAVQIFS